MILHIAGFLATLLSGGRAQLNVDIPSIPADFEPRCIFSGLTFLSGCDPEISKIIEIFGTEQVDLGASNGEVSKKLERFLNGADARPSTECCLAFCVFNNDICSCEPNAKNYIASIFGSMEVYHYLLGFYTKQCGTIDLYDTCPNDPTDHALNEKKLNQCDEGVLFAPAPESDSMEYVDDDLNE